MEFYGILATGVLRILTTGVLRILTTGVLSSLTNGFLKQFSTGVLRQSCANAYVVSTSYIGSFLWDVLYSVLYL